MSAVSPLLSSSRTGTTFSPCVSSPLTRTISPFTEPRTPPCSPRDTAKLWDEYERRAFENAKARETSSSAPKLPPIDSPRLSNGIVLDILRSYNGDSYPPSRATVSVPESSPAPKPRFIFGFDSSQQAQPSLHKDSAIKIAACRTCKKTITSSTGVCSACQATAPPKNEDVYHAQFDSVWRTFAPENSPNIPSQPTSSISRLPDLSSMTASTNQQDQTSDLPLRDFPIRLSSLRPHCDSQHSQPSQPSSSSQEDILEPPRPRKPSLTDPNTPAHRVVRKSLPSASHGPLTILPSTPPGSASQTRPPSLQTTTTPPKYSRHVSATPSELSTLYPYVGRSSVGSASASGSSSAAVCRASYCLQNQISVWEDEDSDDEKRSLVGYWNRWRGSKSSIFGRRESGAKGEEMVNGVGLTSISLGTPADSGVRTQVRLSRREKRHGRIIRALSCGCCTEGAR